MLRGNSLYESYNIIKGTNVKFLVYKDISTDRIYIKYVENKFDNADKAQAWSLSMSLERYEKMTIEA